jgi:putative membrane protein
MTYSKSRNTVIVAISLGALGFACSSDQKSVATASDMSDMPPAQPPADASRLNPEAAATPNGPPRNVPVEAPPPVGINAIGMPNAAVPADPRSPTTQTTTGAQLSQNQIAMISDLANTVEIEQAQLAQSKASSEKVKEFARMMLKAHAAAKNDQAALFQKLGLTATQSPAALEFKDYAGQVLGRLRGADGPYFDHAYINAQVEEHQQVLHIIDQRLLSAATAPALIAELQKMRGTVASHLANAKELQNELTK